MPETLLNAYSTVDEATGAPHIGNATLVVGDGTTKIEFKNGRAKVPSGIAPLIARNPHIEIPGVESDEEAEAPEVEVPETVDHAEEIKARDARIRELEAHLVDANQRQQASGAQPDLEVVNLNAPNTPKEQMLDAAREYLQEEGLDVPETEEGEEDEKPILQRPGFEAETDDGKPRCQAEKGDGTQCANPSVEGQQSCKISKHQEQLIAAAAANLPTVST